MVKIRLRRIGAKGRPFYRVVVAKSTAGRNGAFIETLGTYNPIVKPTHVEIDGERAMHWLMQGAQPTETAARLLNKTGVLEQYFAQRPGAKKDYAFLDKRTAATSVRSVMDKQSEPKAEAAPVATAPVAAAPEPAPAPEPEAAPEPAAEEPVVEVEAAAETVADAEPVAEAEPEAPAKEA